jgi:ABC-type iron transport system FetAB permease component
VLGSISAMKWPVVALLVVGVLAYIADWLAAARMRRVYSEFWYVVRGKRRSGG